MVFLSGCLTTTAAVVSSVAEVGRLYLDANKQPVIVQTAECGNIEPIRPDEGFNERLTEDEKDQIVHQYLRLRELCPEVDLDN